MRFFCVFGDPIAHSKSPILHNYAFAKLGIEALYSRYRLDSPSQIRAAFFRLNLNGANVTLPHKEGALAACDEVRGLAKEIGALNTIVREDSRLIGYNTDGAGFYKCVELAAARLLGESGAKLGGEGAESFGESRQKSPAKTKRPANLANPLNPANPAPAAVLKTALVLGAGGSARAVAFALRENGIAVTVANRSSAKLGFFEERGFGVCLNSEIPDARFDLVVNATAASINGELPLDSAALGRIFGGEQTGGAKTGETGGAKIAFDLMYGRKCAFLEAARAHKIHAIDGKRMLLFQAAAAQSLWTGVDALKIAAAMNEIFDLA